MNVPSVVKVVLAGVSNLLERVKGSALNIAPWAKAAIAAAAAVLVVVLAVVDDLVITPEEWFDVAFAAATAALVYLVPNKEDPPKPI